MRGRSGTPRMTRQIGNSGVSNHCGVSTPPRVEQGCSCARGQIHRHDPARSGSVTPLSFVCHEASLSPWPCSQMMAHCICSLRAPAQNFATRTAASPRRRTSASAASEASLTTSADAAPRSAAAAVRLALAAAWTASACRRSANSTISLGGHSSSSSSDSGRPSRSFFGGCGCAAPSGSSSGSGGINARDASSACSPASTARAASSSASAARRSASARVASTWPRSRRRRSSPRSPMVGNKSSSSIRSWTSSATKSRWWAQISASSATAPISRGRTSSGSCSSAS
mmetsp:Transcript_86033/g.277875  ORF Transcript_86033/g.277875 Transcript_86033/m.277875 type:complete len:285 (+) Transcript_86033:683-1537(+)